MQLHDQSAEYYRLREGHERALALAATTCQQRRHHLLAADHYAALAAGSAEAAATLEAGLAHSSGGSRAPAPDD